MKKITLIRAVFVLSLSSMYAKAEMVIAQFGFASDYTPSYVAPGVSASSFSNGIAITSISLNDDGQPPKSWYGENWTLSDDPDDALNSDSYVSFQVYTEPGVSMSLTKLALDVRPHGSGPQDFLAQVIDLSSGAGSQFGALMFHSDQTRFDDGRKIWESLDAESDSLVNLSGEYEIRIYGFDANKGDRDVLFDNISLEGTIFVIPEPSSFLLLSLSIALLPMIRKSLGFKPHRENS